MGTGSGVISESLHTRKGPHWQTLGISCFYSISISLWILILGCSPFGKEKHFSFGSLHILTNPSTHILIWAKSTPLNLTCHVGCFPCKIRVETARLGKPSDFGPLGAGALVASTDGEKLTSNAWYYWDSCLPCVWGFLHPVSNPGIIVPPGITQQNNYLEFV